MVAIVKWFIPVCYKHENNTSNYYIYIKHNLYFKFDVWLTGIVIQCG